MTQMSADFFVPKRRKQIESKSISEYVRFLMKYPFHDSEMCVHETKIKLSAITLHPEQSIGKNKNSMRQYQQHVHPRY